MSLSNPKLCPLCRQRLLNQEAVGKDTAKRAVARFRKHEAADSVVHASENEEKASANVANWSVSMPEEKLVLVEQAIEQTGIDHHGEALLIICKAYLKK